ncbi:transporter (CPA2 family) [Tahibacter aquaticus]|uniref:Transporter (CPA2 family) n=1 Tax=Tahibacter aquaticus TaxID=520092 RepID=A0A4R6Z7N4_9GAMM|nr:cation:proton antiporter [Tahibacter aquaticus]TDR47785.1 transporter (CPA2 family) [Tahibacter aquaticus]
MSHSPLLLQLVVILCTARVLALALRFIGQPAVIGEMIAGLMLGPMVLGALAPDFHAQLFAPDSLSALRGISQIGLVLFMFIVGAELRMPTGLRSQMLASAWIGGCAMLLPFLFGLGMAPWLHPQLAPAGVGFVPFALFVATAMAITAFPVLARILKDTGLAATPIGQLGLTSAAFADLLAWILLALVVALVAAGSGWSGFARMLFGLAALAFVAFAIVRPALAALLRRHATDGKPDGMVLASLLIVTFAFAALTQWLQLHEVFGAFLFGVCLPRDDKLLDTLVERLEYVAVLVLMPVFFALAGLNTSADAFAGMGGVALLLILLLAIVGKVLGGAAGARLAGLGWRDAFALGTLMNTRGLMELIVLKVGLDVGVIGQEIFTMLMLMAVVTTLMTSPLLQLLLRGRADRSDNSQHKVQSV